MAKTLRGVNLGGWLVLEPWITPSLFKDTSAPDEFTYCDEASPERFHKLKEHHKTWITKNDFEWIAAQGFEAVRIPVGYWIFGNINPYVGAISYLDRAFDWADEYGLKVVLCLHGAPGSQNGEMHSGRSGTAAWADDPTNIEVSLQTIIKLAERYKGRRSLLGIEVLNEPSSAIPRRQLTRYYRSAYSAIRLLCGPRVWVIFDDRFKPVRWQWVLHWPARRNALLDHHHYQAFTPQDKALDIAGHLAKVQRVGWLLRLIGWHRRLIVGEWSAALDPQSLQSLQGGELTAAYKVYVQAQTKAFRAADAWFYWTYRTEDTGPWNLRSMVEQGIITVSPRVLKTTTK